MKLSMLYSTLLSLHLLTGCANTTAANSDLPNAQFASHIPTEGSNVELSH